MPIKKCASGVAPLGARPNYTCMNELIRMACVMTTTERCYCQVRGMPHTGSAGGPAGEAAGAPSVFNPTAWSVRMKTTLSSCFTRRRFIKTAVLSAVAADFAGPECLNPIRAKGSVVNPLPRWRGFNLVDFNSPESPIGQTRDKRGRAEMDGGLGIRFHPPSHGLSSLR